MHQYLKKYNYLFRAVNEIKEILIILIRHKEYFYIHCSIHEITSEIIINYIKNEEDGCEVGCGLSSQMSKRIVYYCNIIQENQKKIGSIYFYKKNISFTKENVKVIEILEVLQNFNKIQDLNYSAFHKYCMNFSEIYNEKTFEYVISKIKYKKSTIAFLEQILNHFNVSNNIKKYLSTLSKYKIPVWRIN